MSDNRLQVRLPPTYQAWLAALGGDARAARTLLALGAAVFGLDGAAAEALTQAGPQLDRATLAWLYDRCTTNVRQEPTVTDHLEVEASADAEADPLLSIGIEV